MEDGSSFEGWWCNGVAKGRGRYIDRPKGLLYEGEWEGNKKNGVGLFRWPDGRTYTGHFSQNMFSGQGKLTWPNGQSYEGQWRAN